MFYILIAYISIFALGMTAVLVMAGIQLLKAAPDVAHEQSEPNDGVTKALRYAWSAGMGNLAFPGWNVYRLYSYLKTGG